MRLLSIFVVPVVAAACTLAACSSSSSPPPGQADAGRGGGGGSGGPGGSDAGDAGDSGPHGDDAGPATDGGVDSGPSLDIPGWTLVFNDEFDGAGPGLDSSKDWQVYSGQQANSPGFSHFDPSEVYVENGVLRLRIEHKTTAGDPYGCGGLEVPIAQARTYGRWVVRARFPAGKGNVGYMGLFGQTLTEIDFGEVAGKTPTVNTFTQHYGPNDTQDQHPWTGTDSTAGFHEYTVIWDGATLTWLVDGVQQYQTKQYFMTESLVVAIGDWAAPCSIDWAGCPDPSTVYPAYMDIDYVRIYQK